MIQKYSPCSITYFRLNAWGLKTSNLLRNHVSPRTVLRDRGGGRAWGWVRVDLRRIPKWSWKGHKSKGGHLRLSSWLIERLWRVATMPKNRQLVKLPLVSVLVNNSHRSTLKPLPVCYVTKYVRIGAKTLTNHMAATVGRFDIPVFSDALFVAVH